MHHGSHFPLDADDHGTSEQALRGDWTPHTGIRIGFLLLIFITQWVQYNLTYKVAYEESANRRIPLAEKLRRLPLAFFGQRDLSDLTTTMMGDCSKLERIFSNAVPSLFGTVIMFVIVSVGLLIMDWRMGLCIVLPVPVAALILIAARKAQTKAESRN